MNIPNLKSKYNRDKMMPADKSKDENKEKAKNAWKMINERKNEFSRDEPKNEPKVKAKNAWKQINERKNELKRDEERLFALEEQDSMVCDEKTYEDNDHTEAKIEKQFNEFQKQQQVFD